MYMNLSLDPSDTLQLRSARNATIRVLEGTVWVTEAGRGGDACLGSGTRYQVRGDGLVLVGADAGAPRARVSVTGAAWLHLREVAQGLAGKIAGAWRAYSTRRQLGDLSDHMLEDIGLCRDQLLVGGRLERRL